MQKKKTNLSKNLYAYVEPANKKFAERMAGQFGSVSAFINTLIARERGVKPKPGKWAPNEA